MRGSVPGALFTSRRLTYDDLRYRRRIRHEIAPSAALRARPSGWLGLGDPVVGVEGEQAWLDVLVQAPGLTA